MKIILLTSILLVLGACGDVGSSSSEANQATNQIYNPVPVDCTIDCAYNPQTGTISASSHCTGASPFPVSVQSLNECDFVTELAEDSGDGEQEQL